MRVHFQCQVADDHCIYDSNQLFSFKTHSAPIWLHLMFLQVNFCIDTNGFFFWYLNELYLKNYAETYSYRFYIKQLELNNFLKIIKCLIFSKKICRDLNIFRHLEKICFFIRKAFKISFPRYSIFIYNRIRIYTAC